MPPTLLPSPEVRGQQLLPASWPELTGPQRGISYQEDRRDKQLTSRSFASRNGQYFLGRPGYTMGQTLGSAETCLSHRACCCSSICLSWHPGPGRRPLFLGRPLGPGRFQTRSWSFRSKNRLAFSKKQSTPVLRWPPSAELAKRGHRQPQPLRCPHSRLPEGVAILGTSQLCPASVPHSSHRVAPTTNSLWPCGPTRLI